MRWGWIAAPTAICMCVAGCPIGGTGGSQCFCPLFEASVAPVFACLPSEMPVLSLSGPCRVDATRVSGAEWAVPIIVGTGAGVCHATLTLGDGASYSTDITFTSEWLACGSDPHGCGEGVASDMSTWTIDNACLDAGQFDARVDGAPDDADE
jgi:hypothetical protein